jgi:TRAP-type C4-dicarboxylate transport system permease small subunit
MRDFVLKTFNLVTIITRWLAIVAAVSIAVMMIVDSLDIIGTKFLCRSIPGALDISEDLMVILTFLPLAFVALERGHIRITLLEERMSPLLRFVFQIIQYVIAILITGFLTWRGFFQFQRTLALMQLKEGIDLPIWPANLTVAIGFGILTLAWMLLLARTLLVGVKK